VPPTAFVALLPALLVPALLVAYPTSVWPAMVVYHAYCLVASFLYEDAHDPRPLHVRLAPPSWPPVVAAGVILAAGELVARGVVDVRPWLPPQAPSLIAAASPWPYFVAYVVAANGYFEERFWRGPMLHHTGILGGAAAFGLMHGTAGAVLFGVTLGGLSGVAAFVAGIAWGALRARYDGLWPCVLTHMALNAAVLRIAWALLVP
jgi:membrane protease YdiL (CAAX protease family)